MQNRMHSDYYSNSVFYLRKNKTKNGLLMMDRKLKCLICQLCFIENNMNI